MTKSERRFFWDILSQAPLEKYCLNIGVFGAERYNACFGFHDILGEMWIQDLQKRLRWPGSRVSILGVLSSLLPFFQAPSLSCRFHFRNFIQLSLYLYPHWHLRVSPHHLAGPEDGKNLLQVHNLSAIRYQGVTFGSMIDLIYDGGPVRL